MQSRLFLWGASVFLTMLAVLILSGMLTPLTSYTFNRRDEHVALASRLPIAKIGWVKMMIEDTVRYQPHALEAANEFANLLPSGGHLVIGDDQRMHTVSMFHQLHCLEIIRQNYKEQSPPSQLALHCLNYLRQSILCLADNRLEPVRSPLGPRVVSFSSDYVCNDWSAVYDAAEKNHRKYLPGRGKNRGGS